MLKPWIAGWLILGAPQVDTPIFHGKNPWLWEDPGNDFAPQDVEPFHRVGKCHSLVECPCRREAWRPPESSGRTCLSTSIGATSKNTSKKNTFWKKKQQQRHRTVVGCHLFEHDLLYENSNTCTCLMNFLLRKSSFFPIPNLDVVDIPNGIVFQKPCCFGILKAQQQFGQDLNPHFFWSKNTSVFCNAVATKKKINSMVLNPLPTTVLRFNQDALDKENVEWIRNRRN